MGGHRLYVQEVRLHLRQNYFCWSASVCQWSPRQTEEVCCYCGTFYEQHNSPHHHKLRIFLSKYQTGESFDNQQKFDIVFKCTYCSYWTANHQNSVSSTIWEINKEKIWFQTSLCILCIFSVYCLGSVNMKFNICSILFFIKRIYPWLIFIPMFSIDKIGVHLLKQTITSTKIP